MLSDDIRLVVADYDGWLLGRIKDRAIKLLTGLKAMLSG